MAQCIYCNSDRIIFITGKTSDCFNISYPNLSLQYDGYVPEGIAIGGGDYIEFSYCFECGRIQDKFPIDKQVIMRLFEN